MAHRLAAAWAGGAAATTEHPCLPLLTKHLVKTPGFVSVRPLTHCVNGFSRVLTFQTSTVFYLPRVGGRHSFLPLVPTFTYRADRGMSGVFHSLPPWRGRVGRDARYRDDAGVRPHPLPPPSRGRASCGALRTRLVPNSIGGRYGWGGTAYEASQRAPSPSGRGQDEVPETTGEACATVAS